MRRQHRLLIGLVQPAHQLGEQLVRGDPRRAREPQPRRHLAAGRGDDGGRRREEELVVLPPRGLAGPPGSRGVGDGALDLRPVCDGV